MESRGGGGCHLRKFNVAILKKICILCSWSLISPSFFFKSQRLGEISIFRPSIANFSNFDYISLKIGCFELGHDNDVTVTSYLGCWYLFWYLWKEETPSYSKYQFDVGLSGGVIFKVTGGGKRCYKKGLVRRGWTPNLANWMHKLTTYNISPHEQIAKDYKV